MPVKETLIIKRIEEFLLKDREKTSIRKLLDHCFQDYPGDDIFFKQIPSFRYLAYIGNELVGHLGVDHRVIKNGNRRCKALCISDVCVSETYRSRKIGSRMMKKMESDAQKAKIDFAILIATQSKIYYNLGYRSRENTFRWLIIQNHESLGLAQRKLGKNMVMVKKISGIPWSLETTDFLGPLF